MKPLLTLSAVLFLAAPALAESRSVLIVVTHDKDGKATVAVHSDDKPDRRDAVTVEEACKAVAGMKGWGSVVNVSVVTDRRMSRKDRKALFDAIDGNAWLDLSSYGPEAPKHLADHFLTPEETGEWQGLEVVAFHDFDDLDVKLGGKKRKAFLVGLQPLWAVGQERAEKVRKDILTRFQKNALSARVVTTRGEAVGLSVDTFMHHKNDFGHPWNPRKYPYCWSGWGEYNFNAYFLHAGLTTFKDTFGRNERYREQFAGAMKALAAPADPEKKQKPVDDDEALAGTWKLTEIELAGNPRPPGANERWVIEKDRIEWDRLRPVTFKVMLDPTKTPRQIDLEIVEGLGKGGKLKGIYKLTDGKLQVCYFLNPEKDERPTEFAGTDVLGKPLPGNPVFLILRREDKDSIFPIREHGVGRWLAIDVPLEVRHDLKTPGLTAYAVTMTVDVLTQKGKPPAPRLDFEITGEFKGVIRPELPPTSHVQLVIDGKETAEYPLTPYASAGSTKVHMNADTTPADYQAMVAAKTVEGRLYSRTFEGKEPRRSDVRSFTLDAKTLRSLRHLDVKVQE